MTTAVGIVFFFVGDINPNSSSAWIQNLVGMRTCIILFSFVTAHLKSLVNFCHVN